MSRKDNSPGISFFSFQDIITSITGIMFLVVLMLVLMILNSPSHAARQKAREVSEEIGKLEEDLTDLRKSLEQLDRQTDRQRKRVAELEKLKLETLPELKLSLIRKLTALDEAMLQIVSETKRFVSLRKKESATGVQLQADLVAANTRCDELKQEITQIQAMLAEKQKLYKRIKNVLRFVWNRQDGRDPVLLVCGETEIVADTLTGNGGSNTFPNYSECLEWIRKHYAPDNTYFVLLLKPGSFPYAEDFSNKLRDAGFQRGREVLPDDKTTVFGEIVK